MGSVRIPKHAKLFTGLLAGEVDWFPLAVRLLCEHFGPVDFESDTWPFDQTDYYEPEMGPHMQRRFVFFDRLVSMDRLPDIKRLTNDVESRICHELGRAPSRRPVNIDPGYVTLGKVVLATTKDHAHRIYLSRGIYAEVTLRYESGQWRSWPWTYPDYADAAYHAALTRARDRLKQQLRETEPGSHGSDSGDGAPSPPPQCH